MKTVMLTMLARLPPARFITWSICETTCFTWASKLLAISLPALSRVAVWPATQTILPPSVTTPGEKARDSWNGVFSRYSAAPAASGSASRRAAVMLFVIGGLLICRWWNEARCGGLRCRARWRESRAGRCFRSPSASARRASASAPGIADTALDVHVEEDAGRARAPRHRSGPRARGRQPAGRTTRRGRDWNACHSFSVIRSPVKEMNRTMQHRHEERTGGDDHHQAAIQRVKPGEELARARGWIVHGSHPAEQHGGVQERIEPGEVLEEHIARHADRQRQGDERANAASMGEHAQREASKGQRRLGARFIHAGQ